MFHQFFVNACILLLINGKYQLSALQPPSSWVKSKYWTQGYAKRAFLSLLKKGWGICSNKKATFSLYFSADNYPYCDGTPGKPSTQGLATLVHH